jgi:hypothetical protein
VEHKRLILTVENERLILTVENKRLILRSPRSGRLEG